MGAGFGLHEVAARRAHVDVVRCDSGVVACLEWRQAALARARLALKDRTRAPRPAGVSGAGLAP
jgi:hypothetical protein